jgi:hypothetical protein
VPAERAITPAFKIRISNRVFSEVKVCAAFLIEGNEARSRGRCLISMDLVSSFFTDSISLSDFSRLLAAM